MTVLTKRDFAVGDYVLFGRTRGQKSVGVVTKLLKKNLRVETQEDRGRSHSKGTAFKVHPSLCTKLTPEGVEKWKEGNIISYPAGAADSYADPNVDDDIARAAGSEPTAPEATGDAGTPGRPQQAIVREIRGTYAALACDAGGDVEREKLDALFGELGRRMTEDEAWDWKVPA